MGTQHVRVIDFTSHSPLTYVPQLATAAGLGLLPASFQRGSAINGMAQHP